MTSNADTLQLFCQIQAQQGARKAVTVDKNVTATALRQEVSKTTSIPLDKLRLIFRGRMIKDEDTKPAIEEYRLEGDAVLHCMGNPEVTTTATTTTTTDAAPGVATSTNTNGTSTTAANAVSSAAAAAAVSVPPLSTTTVSNPVAVAVAAATSSSGASAAAAPPSDPVAVALMRLRASNAPSVYKTAVETLLKVLTNIADKPMDEKYRKVKRGNAVFQKRLGGVPGGHEAMLAVGFVVETDAAAGDGGGEVYQLHASAEQWPKLMQSKDRVSEAVALVQQHQPSQSGASFGAAAAGVPAMPFGAAAGFGGGGMPNPMDAAGMMNDPAAQSAMLQMMSDPQSLQAALQVRTFRWFSTSGRSWFSTNLSRFVELWPNRSFLPDAYQNTKTLHLFFMVSESNGAEHDA